MKRLAAFVLTLALASSVAAAQYGPFGLSTIISPAHTTPPSGTTFTALHTYYMSPTGNDSNNGSMGAPWRTPNHSVVCGDVIIAAAGAYSTSGIGFGNVSNCPSTTGGIDGNGGIYFAVLLCAGPSVGDCSINYGGAGGAGIEIASSNWAVSGWKVSSAAGRSFEANACASGSTIIHHVAFINTISTNSQQGFDTNECAINHNVPGNGVDYFAVVGSIAQNSANDPICLGAVDVVAPAMFDSNPGTHIFIGGVFAIANREPSGCSDGEGILFDTWDAHGYAGQGVIEQSVSVGSGRYGIQIFDQFINSSAPHINVFKNTVFDNFYVTGSDFADGEINYQPNSTNSPWVVSITNNVAKTRVAASPSGTPLYAFLDGNPSPNTTIGGAGAENIFKGNATTCRASCDAGNNVVAFNGSTFGTNIYVDPNFVNAADLVANHYGSPNCSGFATVTACMGWNHASRTVTPLSVIDDLTPQAASAAGKGYQTPGDCAPDPYFPTWLKDVVYLHVESDMTTVKMYDGLVQKPCGL